MPQTRSRVLEARLSKQGERKGRKVTVTTEPAKPPIATVASESSPGTLIERVLGAGGLDVLQLALVGLFAFLVAAVLQRVLYADYSIKIGTLELSKVSRDSASGLEKLKEKVDKDVGKLREEIDKELATLRAFDASATQTTAKALVAIEVLEERIAEL